MGLFLQIVGGLVITLILIVIGLYLFVKLRFGKWFKLDGEQNHTPLRVHLNEDFAADWMDRKEASAANDVMLELGFTRGKSYTIPELPDINLTSYFNAPVVGVVYRHDIAGVWVDFAVESEDQELTVSNGSIGAGTEYRPEKLISWHKDHSVSELYQEIQTKLEPNAKYTEVNEESFREYFELSYRKDMAYRARNGGMSHDEFLRHVDEFGKKFSDQELHQAFVEAKLQEIEQWSETALEEFVEAQTDEQRDKFYETGDGYLIVPYTSHPEAFISYLEDIGFIGDDATEALAKKFSEEKDLFFLFDLLNAGRSPELRAKQIGHSDYPLDLKIFSYQYS